MANIKLQNIENNFSGKEKPIQCFIEDKKINIYTNDRIFYESAVQSNFPSSVNFEKTKITIDFENGTINDSSFVNIIPSSNNFRLAQVYYTRNKTIEVRYSLLDFSTREEVLQGFIDNEHDVCGNKVYGAIKIFSVILSSAGSILNIINEDDLFVESPSFKFLNSVNDIFTETDIVHFETLIVDVFDGENSVKVDKTVCEIGDLIKVQKLLDGTQEEFPVGTGEGDFLTVTNVVKGELFDEVFFTPTVVGNFTVGEAARIIKINVTEFKTSFLSYSENQPYDTGWIFVSSGTNGNFAHPENKSFSGNPIVYYSPTGSDSDVRIIPHGYASGATQIGIWIDPDTGGLGTFSYEIGSSGIFFDFETNSLRTTGFIRIVLSRA
jgi:hypothetical protein